MIKLFLFTLLCVAVFADTPADDLNKVWTGPAGAAIDTAHYFMRGQSGSSLVRRAAQEVRPPGGGPPRGQPGGSSGGSPGGGSSGGGGSN
ncbi:uncharacterized protein LOC114254221 [Monomorium pharaonis]|uniref:uncharacterized protein LOC114254221 n=1 Tax=Monomorium pharaonis TaxID=307658 RepID=UPI00102E21D6|nr:uncharacterized protein LOC114254221 [Monomorium pharaonis]